AGKRLAPMELERRALRTFETPWRTPRRERMRPRGQLDGARRDVALRHVHVPAGGIAVVPADERPGVAPRIHRDGAGRGGAADLDPPRGRTRQTVPEKDTFAPRPEPERRHRAGETAPEPDRRRLERGARIAVEARAVY